MSDESITILVQTKKAKDIKNSRNEKNRYSIFDDKNIESLMRYYKIEKPDVLFKYLKKHNPTRNIDDIPLEKESS
jgi:hypothetical protein